MIGRSPSCGESDQPLPAIAFALQLPGECITVKRCGLGLKPSVRALARVESLKRTVSGGFGMTRNAAILLLLLTAWTPNAFAQQADDTLNDTQKLGRQVFAQSCGVCHLPPAINARTYGPGLSKDTAGGSDEVIRGVISEGTPRMPAFKHYLQRGEIDAIIAYLKTVPATATR
jgi:mono/diheme cytochrome c family protein